MYHHHYELGIMASDRRAELLREADRDRLAEAAHGRGPRQIAFQIGEILIRLGEALIRLGMRRTPSSQGASRA